MNTKDFQTKTIIQNKDNASANGYWVVAMDIGYSAVKGISRNSAYCFPSFARKVNPDSVTVGEPAASDIQYRDENGETWDVGAMAVSMISQNDTQNSDDVLFTRNRYFNPMFLVIARVGIAMGLRANKFGDPANKTLVVQTGLPPIFIKGDAPNLKRVLSGDHKFSIRVGNSPWQNYEFSLPPENISIMSQPMGSLFSATFKNDCSEVDDAKKFFNSNLLMFDGGFGTLDTFEIKHCRVENTETFDHLGMKAVLQKTSEKIYAKYNTEISVTAMQNNLRDGYVKLFDVVNMKTQKIAFGDILAQSSTQTCQEAINQIKTVYNNLIDCKYLVITGGTGAAWFNQMKEYFSGMEDLEVVLSSYNSDLPPIFSNVRGYYLFQVSKLRKLAK